MAMKKKQTALDKAQAALSLSSDDHEDPDVINSADLGDADPEIYDEGDAHDHREDSYDGGQHGVAGVESYLPEPTEAYPWLLFEELIFRDGLNLTVRHGPKWLNFKGDVQIGASEDDPVMAIGEVIDTLYISRFDDLNNENLILRLAHDSNCRGFYDLVKTMKRRYPSDTAANIIGFTREGPVTLVFFVLRIVSDGVVLNTPVVIPDLQTVAEIALEAQTQSGTMEGRLMLASDVR